jgi:hypothetical protein
MSFWVTFIVGSFEGQWLRASNVPGDLVQGSPRAGYIGLFEADKDHLDLSLPSGRLQIKSWSVSFKTVVPGS